MSQVKNKGRVEAPTLNLLDVFSLGFGGAVGAGIFVLTGLSIAATGRSIVLSIIGAVIFMVLANLFSVIIASMFTLKGGDYSQKALVFNPLMTGVTGYVNFAFGFSIAMYAIAIVDYSSMIFPGIMDYAVPIELAIVTLFFLMTMRGSKFLSQVNNLMTFILIGAVLLFIMFGLFKVQPGYFHGSDLFKGGTKGFISAVALMSFACQGITQGPVSVAAVTKDAKRTVPKAMGLVAIALAVFYGLIAYVAAGVLPYDQVAGKNLSLVAQQVFPHWVFVVFILGGAVLAIATSMIGMITMVRYPILKVAEDGWLPNFFTKTDETGYPYVIYGLFYILSIVPIVFGFSLDVIVSLIMIPLMLMNVYLNLGCLRIIKDFPQHWESSILHMPNGLVRFLCVIAALCSLIVCYNLFVMLTIGQRWAMLALIVFLALFAQYRLQKGYVNEKQLNEEKNSLYAEIEE